jgi:predicted DNA-binding ribbon-helix-helix protein
MCMRMEAEFWQAARDICWQEHIHLAGPVQRATDARKYSARTTAVRVNILEYCMSEFSLGRQATEPRHHETTH